MKIPSDINLDILPGPDRKKLLWSEDLIVWSPQKTNFALAYSVSEVTMGSYVGSILWGTQVESRSIIIANPYQIGVAAWASDWCHWLDEQTFVFKAQISNNGPWQIPLVCINFAVGYALVPNSNNLQSRPQHITAIPNSFRPFDADDMLKEIINSK